MNDIWTEEQQREAVTRLADQVSARGAPEAARRCCYPGVLRFLRSNVPVEQQVELMTSFLAPHPQAAELGHLLAGLNCWSPVFNEPWLRSQGGLRLVSRAEAELRRGPFPVTQPIDKPQVETLRGALHAIVTAMTQGRRGLLGDWASKPLFDAEVVFKVAVDELLAGDHGFAVRCAKIFLAGGWPIRVEGCNCLIVGRLI